MSDCERAVPELGAVDIQGREALNISLEKLGCGRGPVRVRRACGG